MAISFLNEKENIFLTEGVSGAIKNIIECYTLPGKNNIVFPHPTFTMYSIYCKMFNLEQRKIGYTKNYELDFIKVNNDSYISVLILERFLNSKLISQDSAKKHYNNFTKRVINSPSGININQILKI